MSGPHHIVHQPAGILRRYVREILWVHSNVPRTQILLPETNLTFVFRQTGAAFLHGLALPSAVFSGLQSRTRSVEYRSPSSTMIVRFTEAGASALMHERTDLFYDRTLPLDTVLPQSEIERVQNMLVDADSIEPCMLAIERLLISRMHARYEISPQIEAAVSLISRSAGKAPIALVAKHAGMSRSALERHFRAAIGTTPKGMSRLARLQNICRLHDAGKSFTDIAHEAGYFDQPHMVRDFQLFTGSAPEAFFKSGAPRNLPHFSSST